MIGYIGAWVGAGEASATSADRAVGAWGLDLCDPHGQEGLDRWPSGVEGACDGGFKRSRVAATAIEPAAPVRDFVALTAARRDCGRRARLVLKCGTLESMDDSATSGSQVRASDRTWGRRLGQSVVLAASALFAAIVHWPDFARFSIVAATVLCLGTVAFTAASVLLWQGGGQRPNAGFFGGAGVFFPLPWGLPSW